MSRISFTLTYEGKDYTLAGLEGVQFLQRVKDSEGQGGYVTVRIDDRLKTFSVIGVPWVLDVYETPEFGDLELPAEGKAV